MGARAVVATDAEVTPRGHVYVAARRVRSLCLQKVAETAPIRGFQVPCISLAALFDAPLRSARG